MLIRERERKDTGQNKPIEVMHKAQGGRIPNKHYHCPVLWNQDMLLSQY